MDVNNIKCNHYNQQPLSIKIFSTKQLCIFNWTLIQTNYTPVKLKVTLLKSFSLIFWLGVGLTDTLLITCT